MSLPQQHPTPDSPQDDPQPSSSSNIVHYDSIQGALGSRRISQPIPATFRSVSDIHAHGQQHMASDSRYVYPSTSPGIQQSHHYQYEQHSYPPSPPSYESQFSHNSLPRMRTPPDASRSSVNQSPQGYGAEPYIQYAQPQQSHYAVPSGMPATSWTGSYAQYPQTPTDVSLSPELVRTEPIAQLPQPQPATSTYRAPVPGYPTHLDNASRHSSSSSSRAPSASDSKGKQREVPPSTSRPRVSEELDFHKLSATYQNILDNAAQPSQGGPLPHSLPSGLPASDILDRIYDFAIEGVRQFDPEDREDRQRSSTPQPRSQSLPRGGDSGKGSSKRQRTDASTAESQKCMGCGATSTPEWRRGPLGPRTLCNACGLVYAKLIKRRGRDAAGRSIMEGAAAYAAAHAAGAVPGEFVQDYGLTAGQSSSLHHSHNLQDDEDQEALPVSSAGEGSEDGSYEDVQGHPSQLSSARGPPLD